MYLVTYITLLGQAEETLGRSYRLISQGHVGDADVHYGSHRVGPIGLLRDLQDLLVAT